MVFLKAYQIFSFQRLFLYVYLDFYISTSSKEQIISDTKSWNDYVKSVIVFTYPVIFRTILVLFVITLVKLRTNILIFRNKYFSISTF